MRRISALLALAAILLAVLVAYTYKLRIDWEKKRHVEAAPKLDTKNEALADHGWHWQKDDPQTNHPIVIVNATAFQAVHQPYTFKLQNVSLRLYSKDGSSYTYVRSGNSLFDQWTGLLKSDGPVTIIMNVPADKNAEKPEDVAKLVRIETSGVTYESKSGKAETDKAASFKFAEGDGQAVGAAYDPSKRELHLKSQISLNWIGGGPAEKAMHIETGDLVYKELEQKVYLSPWSKLQRQQTTIQARSSVVTLIDGVLHQVDSDHAFGTNDQDDRHQDYSADKMNALFDDNGALVNVIADTNARIVSSQPGSRTTVTSNRADLRFAVDTTEENGKPKSESLLHLVMADGHAVSTSVPLPQPNTQLAETRILRSEHIELEMKPDGQNIQEVRTIAQGQLEFIPNRPEQSHRTLDASRLRILYGPSNAIDTFLAWTAVTRTDKPASAAKKDPQTGKPIPASPALTWSDTLTAKFIPETNQVANIEQVGHFRYQEGARQAHARKAFLEQKLNRITLTDEARIWDDTGSTNADIILMNQQNGDIDAMGRVVSSREPEKNAKPGTSMLDASQTMQAKADSMQTRDNNLKVHYDGHAIVWQGANRISANTIDIDRDEGTLHAAGAVVSELVDNKPQQNGPNQSSATPLFTTVRAPEMLYRDDSRVADYTGGVKLLRGRMTVTSKELRAFLTPKSESNNDSSLDHAFADGKVVVFEAARDRTRTGTSDHAEYYPKLDKVMLNGGLAQMADSVKGTTRGRQLTYYSDDDRLVVEGQKNELAFTQMKKK